MNILFIEDEKELAATGVAQLELKGYKVFPAYDLNQARAILDDPKNPIHYVITDHRLPDGWGIQFVIEIKKTHPKCKCAVVSGCLTPRDLNDLNTHNIPYHHKPLLYTNVIDQLRRLYAAQAAQAAETARAAETVEAKQATQTKQAVEHTKLETVTEASETSGEKRGLKLWPFKK